jgi:cytosine/adenosine deaminase-related metal-dependent hydrolase
MADIILRGGTILPMDPARSTILDGAVAITGNRIAAIGPRAEIEAAHTAPVVLDTRNHAILPGLIDAHAHAGHGLIKTLGSGDSKAWYQACAHVYTQASDPDFWRAEARLAALERLSFGVTTGLSLLGGGDSVMRSDSPAHAIAHIDGVNEIGIRAILAIGPTRPPHPHTYASWESGAKTTTAVPFEQQLETIETLLRERHGQGRIAIATLMPVHRDRATPPDTLREIVRQSHLVRELGRRHNALFHQDGHGAGSVELAHDLFDLLGPDASFSHSTDLTARDIDLLAETGTVVVHNPSAVASVRGYCPVPELLDRGVNVILGSDGTAPDRSTDMFRHMFQCMRLHQRAQRDERLMPPGKVLEMVTIDAARGLRMDHEIGSLEPGKRADIITIDLRKPHLAPRNMPLWRVVCFANGQDVDTVLVDGQILMRGRRFPHIDQDAVLDAAEAETERMLDRAGLRPLLREPPELWGRTRR